MAARSFIDTNVLIYAEANDVPAKQMAALALLKRLHEDGTGTLSTQILQEYCNVMIKKLKLPYPHIRAQLDLHAQFAVVQVTPAIIRAALDLHQTRSLGFFDAAVVASAQIAGCTTLYSDDMNAGEQIAGLRIVNPFG